MVARAQRGWNDDCVYFTVKPKNGGKGGDSGQKGNGGGNLQKFNGKLGATAPAVTKDGDKFKVDNQTFNDVQDAIEASCNDQRNQCADAANRTGEKDGVNIPACDDQRDKCIAGNTPQGVGPVFFLPSA